MKITDAQYQNLRQTFKSYDLNGDSQLDRHELLQVLKKLDVPNAEKDIEDVFAKIDLNNDGSISFAEFMKSIDTLSNITTTDTKTTTSNNGHAHGSIFPPHDNNKDDSKYKMTVCAPPILYNSAYLGYGQVVTIVGPCKTCYIAGQGSFDVHGVLQGIGSKAEQFKLCAQNVKWGLEAAGGVIENITQLSVYIVDYDNVNDLPVIAPLLNDFIKARVPTTLLGVANLAQKGMLVEIDAIAQIPLRDKHAHSH